MPPLRPLLPTRSLTARVASRYLNAKRKAKPAALGDCYEAAARYMLERCMSDPKGCQRLRLVHAEVMGQGPLVGVTYGHAFVLDGGMVIDQSNGRNLHMPQSIYYKIGQINRIGNIHEYTWEQAREKLLQTSIYGPWDLHTQSNL